MGITTLFKLNNEVDTSLYNVCIKRIGKYTLEKEGDKWNVVKCCGSILFTDIDKLVDFKYNKYNITYKYYTVNQKGKYSIISIQIQNHEYSLECLKLVKYGFKKNLEKS